MNRDIVNSFIQSTNKVLTQLGVGFSLQGKPTTKDFPLSLDGVLVMIGVTGDLKGQAFISLSEDAVIFIASKMAGMDLSGNLEMALSAISEVMNMIGGNAMTDMAEKDYKDSEKYRLDITPPSLLTGKEITYTSPIKDKLISLRFGDGEHSLDLDMIYSS